MLEPFFGCRGIADLVRQQVLADSTSKGEREKTAIAKLTLPHVDRKLVKQARASSALGCMGLCTRMSEQAVVCRRS